jgi:hypothetical protein
MVVIGRKINKYTYLPQVVKSHESQHNITQVKCYCHLGSALNKIVGENAAQLKMNHSLTFAGTCIIDLSQSPFLNN